MINKSNSLLLILFLFFSFQTSLIYSQDFWKHTNGPNGGIIGDVAINSIGHIFAGGWSDNSGLFRSKNNGLTWEKVNSGFPDFEIYAIGVSDNDDIFIGTNHQGIFRSTDNGETWEQKDNGYTTSECWTFALNDSGYIFAGDGDWSGLYYSSDNGENWIWLIEIPVLYLARSNNGFMFAGTWSGMYRSTDDGMHWEVLNNSPDFTIPCIAFDSSDNILIGTGYYSNGNGVYISSDYGESWQQIGLEDTIVQSIIVTDDNLIVAGTFNDGVFSSSDCGRTWIQSNTGLLTKNIFRLKQDQVGNLFIGSERNGGVYKSEDNSSSWQQIGIPTSVVKSMSINHTEQRVFAATSGGVHCFDLVNETWNNLGFEDVRDVALKNDSILFAAVYPGRLFRSFDNGLTWELTGFPDTLYINKLLIREDGALIATSSNYARISYNNGDSWEIWNNGLHYWTEDIIINNENHIFITNSANVYRSTNQGQLFEQVNGGHHSISAIAVNNNGGVFISDDIAVQSGGGIFRSLDNGTNWEKVKSISATTIKVLSDQRIYSGGYSIGIIRSHDNGITWEDISSGTELDNPVISFLESPDGYLFAGTYGAGMYVTNNKVVHVNDNENAIYNFSLSYNYPNPFNPTTKIKFTVGDAYHASPMHVLLRVYDILGREVATLVNEEKPYGDYEVEFNAGNLASGVYYYQLKVGDLPDGKAGFIQTKKMILIK